MSASAAANKTNLVFRRLYRSLLKTSKPFTGTSTIKGTTGQWSPVTLTCLLHRTGIEDESWADFLRGISSSTHSSASEEEEESEKVQPEASSNKENRDDTAKALFRKLLREVVTGSPTGIRQMQFPSQVDTNRLRTVIQREFRGEGDAVSSRHDVAVRRDVAFMALRELNTKLAFASALAQHRSSMIRHPQQAARHVAPLPLQPSSSYLRPGAYLLAHPCMSGYFRRSVICILEHKQEDDSGGDDDDASGSSSSGAKGTYGLIVNRVSISPHSGKTMSLEDTLRPLPIDLADTFGKSTVKEGGPVHMSLQMLYTATTATADEEEISKIGGTVLSPIPANEEKSTATDTDKVVYYRGNIAHAAAAVRSGKLDREDVSFFVGASCWSVGQLESEIERGCWLPCSGPVTIAHSGICDHDPTTKGEPRPEADLWLSMMTSIGEAEADLAHLMYRDTARDINGAVCDNF